MKKYFSTTTALQLVIPISFILLALASATTKSLPTEQGTVRISQKQDEIFTKSSLAVYLRQTRTPTIVLRVPNQGEKILEEKRFLKSQGYNTIEKELAKADFTVRDRALYQKVLDQNLTNEYSKIKELTDTDLILEIVADDNETYVTNKYTSTRGKEKITDGPITIIGQKLEFKLIKVKDNDLVGSYTFHLSPCTSGCEYLIDRNGGLYSGATRITKPYEFVTADRLEEFYKTCTKLLIRELKG